MKFTSISTRRASLHSLSEVKLTGPLETRLNHVLLTNVGEPAWRLRKASEARELFALSQVAPDRVQILEMNLLESIRVVFALRTPVPLEPDLQGELRFESEAVLGLDYPRQAVSQVLPGSAFLCILQPRQVWLGNVSQPHQQLCLGAKMAAGTRCRNLVMMTYAALSGQTLQEVDPRSGPGVMNLEAAFWWQRNLHRLPFSTEPFLTEPTAAAGGGL